MIKHATTATNDAQPVVKRFEHQAVWNTGGARNAALKTQYDKDLKTQLGNLLERIARWHNDRKYKWLTKANMQGNDVPPAHLIWPMLGLVRYQRRKAWAFNLLEESLSADWEKDPPPPSNGKSTKGTVERPVPGHPEWTFYIDGDDGALINHETRDRIDLLADESVLSGYYFRDYVAKTLSTRPTDKRLQGLFLDGWGLLVALKYLYQFELKHIIDDEQNGLFCFGLSDRMQEHVKPIVAFLKQWDRDDADRLTLSMVLGDWRIVEVCAVEKNRPKLAALAAVLQKESNERWYVQRGDRF
jgi:hypothetical protein